MTPPAAIALARGVPDTRYRATIAADGAVYHWPFDEGRGSFYRADGTTPAAVPYFAGMTYRAADRWGDRACLSFDGTKACLTPALTLGSPTRVVVQALCYFPAYGATAIRTIWEYSPTWFGFAGTFFFNYDGGAAGSTTMGLIGCRIGAQNYYAEVPRPPVGWVLITCVYDSTQVGVAKFDAYYDGVVQAKSAASLGSETAGTFRDDTLAIGFRSSALANYAGSGVLLQHLQIYTGAGFTTQRITEHARHARAPIVDSRAQYVISSYGDSITTGYTTALGYPSRLLHLLRKRGYREIVQRGSVAGSYDGRETWRSHDGIGGKGTAWFATDHPELLVGGDLAIVMLGTNDCGGSFAFDLTAAQWAANMTTIRDTLIARGTKKIIIIPPYRGLNYPADAAPWTTAQRTRCAEFYAASSALAVAGSVYVCTDVYDNFNTGTMLQEYVHPNDVGDEFIAQTIYDFGATNGLW